MKRLAFIIVFCCCSVFASAQFGINVRHNWNDAPNWVLSTTGNEQEISILEEGFSYGLDYWFRLKNYRVEFVPELNYGRYWTSNPNLDHLTKSYSLFFNTNLYLFDFKGDCDCPTFSKEGPTLEKGFFIQISPGISYFSYRDSFEGEIFQESSELVFSVAGAVGFDLGLSDLITLTPMIGLRYYPNNFREGVTEIPLISENEFTQEESSIRQTFAGLRLGIRLDQ